MHDTFIENIKFHLDHFDKHENTCFLAGWVYSTNDDIEILRVESLNQFSAEISEFEIRHDVNKFYSLSEQYKTGFKFILTPKVDFPSLIFSIKMKGQDRFKVIKDVANPSYGNTVTPQPPQLPDVNIGNPFPGIVVVENFYDNPDKVREYALTQEFKANNQHHKGARTQAKAIFPGTKEFIESTLHKKVTNWENHIYNGVFQYCVAEDPLVYHTDTQAYAAVVFLTPNAPAESGTSFYKSRFTGLLSHPSQDDCQRLGRPEHELSQAMFAGNFYDKTRWETVDVIGNVYNRMVIWDAKKVHAASAYFGDNIDNGRLFHMFFFDAE